MGFPLPVPQLLTEFFWFFFLQEELFFQFLPAGEGLNSLWIKSEVRAELEMLPLKPELLLPPQGQPGGFGKTGNTGGVNSGSFLGISLAKDLTFTKGGMGVRIPRELRRFHELSCARVLPWTQKKSWQEVDEAGERPSGI